MSTYYSFFVFVQFFIIRQHVFVNGFTGGGNKFCNLGLSRTQSSFIYQGVQYVMYMSLCKPLRDIPRVYMSGLQNPDDRKIIILKKSQLPVDLVASTSGDFIYDDDNNEAKLELDSPCKELSTKHLNSSVVITFECSQEENEPIFEDFRQDSCSFVFKWQAPFFCLLSHQNQNGNCLLKFENDIFDIKPLTHPSYYALQQGDYKVYINFCGPVNLKDCKSSGGIISGCVIHKNKTYVMENNNCKMTFLKEKSRIEVEYCMIQGVQEVIALQCNRDAIAIKPEMKLTKKSRRLSVILETSSVCLNDDRCDVNYEEERYTLPGTSNRLIKDLIGTFLLSACGPLKPDPFWLGGEASAALINETVMSLGSKRLLERVRSGVLTLTLTEGSFCPGTKQRAKTVIKLVCSDKDTGPVFVDKSVNCVFSFEWRGPSYCPVREATGTGCNVRDPNYGIKYRLDDDDGGGNEVETLHKDIKFRLNLCGKKKMSCDSDMDAGVCLLTHDKEIVLGKRSTQTYSFKNGSLVFQLWGAECAPNVTSHVIVNVVCEFGASDRFLPILNENDSSCVFNFVWYTGKKCPKGEQLPCTVKNQNGSVVDLNPLRLLSSNYRVPKDDDSYFLLNVCGPLWYGPYETCPPSSAACFVKNIRDFESVGEVYKNLAVNDRNEVILVYENVHFLPPWETIITFICDEKHEGPQYIGSEDLKHLFKWRTKLACFNETKSDRIEEVVTESKPEVIKMVSNDSIWKGVFQGKPEEITRSSKTEEVVSCITSNPESSIDLSVLEPVFVNLSICTRLYVDVCKNLSCVSSNSSEFFRLGSRINRPIVDDRGFVTVDYYGDVLCSDHSNVSLSFIFVCDKSQGKGIPRLENKTSCSYTFLWHTRVVCPSDVLILDKSGHRIVNQSNNEIVAIEGSLKNPIQIERESESFYVNLFSSNTLDDEAPCSGNICEKKNESWISHGIMRNSISYNYNYDRIIMEFDVSDLCTGTRRYSSKIYLNCSENGISHPKTGDWVISRGNCELVLELVTPCFDIKRVNEASPSIIFLTVFGVLLVLCSMSLGLYCNHKKRKRRLSCSEMMLIRKERQKYCEKEL